MSTGLDLPNTDLGGGPIVAGSPFAVTIPLVGGSRNDPLVGVYDGSEVVSGVMVPGPGLPAVWTLGVDWAEDDTTYPPASVPALDLSWDGATTEDVVSGTYYALVTVDGASAYLGTFTLIGGVDADATILPTPILTAAEFLARVGTWPASLQTPTNTTGLMRTLALATGDLHSAITERHLVIVNRGHGYEIAADRTAFGTAIAAVDGLTITEPMKDYVAARAMYRLLRYAVGAKDSAGQIESIRMHAERDAEAALRRVVAYVDGYDWPVTFGGQARVHRG